MGSPRPVIVITGKRRPHEVFLFGYSIVAGVVLLTRDVLPPSVQDWGVPWAVALSLSGLLGLVGCYWPQRDMWLGLSLERAGLLFNAGCLFAYAVLVVTHHGWPALFTAGIAMAWAVANVVRSLQISNDLRSLGRRVRAANRRIT